MKEQKRMDLFDEEKKYIKGKLIVMIFHNEQNLYSVARIRIKETNENYDEKEVVVTGNFPRLHEEEMYTFFGNFKEHPKFGLQYHTDHYRKELPQSKEGIIQYLSSDLFKGIGKKTAENIVETLGETAISQILENSAVLENVPRLPEEKAETISRTLQENEGMEQVMIALSQYGFGPQLSMKIYQAYLDETLEVLESNPYKLIEDIEGIGFARADELGRAFGLKGNHPDRIKAGILYLLDQQSMQEGHVYLKKDALLASASSLLTNDEYENEAVSEGEVAAEIEALSSMEKLVLEDGRVYLPSLFFAEKGLVTNIHRILTQSEFADQFPEAEFLKELGELEEREEVEFAPTQKEAIQKALSSPMMILTGGPGTGKTTVTKGIVEVFAELHGLSLEPKDYMNKSEPFPVLLAAPTGRAAKRMSEATGLPAVTIHRLLGWNGNDGFDHDEENMMEGRLLIIDEVSMVDVWLANQLFKSVPEKMQVILVGDEDQLPSVGPGQVLKDLLKSGSVPTVKLTDIYRQEEGSSIIELAHSIKNGTLPENLAAPQNDRRFFPCRANQVLDIVEQISANAVKKGYAPRDIQVLAPMYKGPAGIERLNLMLQKLFNPKKETTREITVGDLAYRVGDKVLQLVNQPEKQVFNGDIGEIVAIFYARENTEKEDQLVVSFDGIEVTYSRQDLNQLTHAYCCSIHKAQGSEFPIVIMPIVQGYYRMLRRNLIYTGITRSKQFLLLCGEQSAIETAVNRTNDNLRQTTLTEKLAEVLGPASIQEDGVLQDGSIPRTEDDLELELEPDEDMENLTPYDFLD
ncbi:SF1B family DNA helicase RecD2 [Bacillus marinisedimentorum]|uniref:SF1B family DNA helicase RecD2 n=1 Tax=Bacillus marinisedimentorum TaxID=1821260 RepID=UPI0007DF0A9E|nr:ATP-dependent RecD-like DNA helicase [Bacillus marinisedimentorum]